MRGKWLSPESTMSFEKSLIYRCLSLTGSFETSRVAPRCFAKATGNFDGQGLSFGVLQWNFGQGTLQKLLTQMNEKYPAIVKEVFGHYYPALVQVMSMKPPAAIKWAIARQNAKRRLKEPWKTMFWKLGMKKACQEVQTKRVRRRFKRAMNRCARYRLISERAVALMFDINVQNGSIPSKTRVKIEADFKTLPLVLSPKAREEEKLMIIANRRAEAAKPRFIEDVRSRKLCCAKGKGRVHGITYNIREQFGITLNPFETA